MAVLTYVVVICVLVFNINVVINDAVSRDRNEKPFKVVCYFGAWALYRDPSLLNLTNSEELCTHVLYSFAVLNGTEMVPSDPLLDLPDGKNGYNQIKGLRLKNPNITIMIAIGGWTDGSEKYSIMANDTELRDKFVKSVVKFLEQYDFDGIDLDWEYPTQRGGVPEDKQNFATLCEELRSALAPGGYVLSAAVSSGKWTVDQAYDIPALNNSLDFINLMTYDFYGSWNNVSGHNAPLYSRLIDNEARHQHTVDFAARYWIQQGASPKKLILGMPTYGRTFKLANANDSEPFAPTNGTGIGHEGTLSYFKVCNLVPDYWLTRDCSWKAPYMVQGDNWIGFDDQESIAEKTRYAVSMGLGGAMIWSLDQDDTTGMCGHGRFPLLKSITHNLYR